MSSKRVSLVEKLEETLKELVIDGSEHVLSLIIRMEMDELAKQDPSFPKLAEDAKKVVLLVDKAVEKEEGNYDSGTFLKRLREYAEILDSIAEAVSTRNNAILIDCIAHLQEFVEINNGEKA